jgi:DHA1 family tetracycline resistance protein-like MFS transporter
LQGALASLVGLASLIGPTVFTQTFAVFIGERADLKLPGAPFLLASVLVFTGMVLAWRTTQPPGIAAVTESA